MLGYTINTPLYTPRNAKESSAPVGVIVLEGCAVKTVNIDSRPYTFSLGKKMARVCVCVCVCVRARVCVCVCVVCAGAGRG